MHLFDQLSMFQELLPEVSFAAVQQYCRDSTARKHSWAFGSEHPSWTKTCPRKLLLPEKGHDRALSLVRWNQGTESSGRVAI